ncbi:deoxyguanosinetriphosphate triphosphohydrolase family protein [Sciscionella marina]|uniref:deoxyguanosinetriphosphate triphosphohydrolase family protein n=1 Tax=Sciscionella marina TaxID=508770 RepID=UPI000379A7C1|nr:dNTP triphosphohydrolase [Sciscionella marina]
MNEQRESRNVTAPARDLAADPFRVDRDRVASSPYFSRLGGVTQVVSPGGSGLLLHNRLTHSLRVAQIARVIAERLCADESAAALAAQLGGCDPDVAEAAALAHDLGHAPFGHLGEEVLDRMARDRFGLPDGFEGNAQSFRIITSIDTTGPIAAGLDLTAATRAAVLKYPWSRRSDPQPHPSTMRPLPRGAAAPDSAGSAKFGAYVTELEDMRTARAPFAKLIEPWRQTVEASVMDTADDIANAINDVEDFYRIGVLQHTSVSAELSGWLSGAEQFAALPAEALEPPGVRPGSALEALRRRLHAKDSWAVDDEAFAAAVGRVRTELVDGLLTSPFDGSTGAEQAVARFFSTWAARLVDGVRLVARPPVRSGHVLFDAEPWHEAQVLKFVHERFVLRRADFAMHQRGQARLLTTLVEELTAWLTDRHEVDRLPARLRDLVELAAGEYATIAKEAPELLMSTTRERSEVPGAVRELARGRAVLDYVASVTDSQAVALLDAITGRTGTPWTETLVL